MLRKQDIFLNLLATALQCVYIHSTHELMRLPFFLPACRARDVSFNRLFKKASD